MQKATKIVSHQPQKFWIGMPKYAPFISHTQWSPATISGSYFLRGMVRKAAFWLPVIAALPTIAKRLNPDIEVPIDIRTFVFDAIR